MAAATTPTTLKQHRRQRIRLKISRWVFESKGNRMDFVSFDVDWSRLLMISLARFRRRHLANHFNFPVDLLAVRQSLIATQLELRLQRHHTDFTEHAWIVEGFSELTALWVNFLSFVILNVINYFKFFSNDSSNSRSSFESGFYNNLSRSNSPLVTEQQDLPSPTFENRSLADLMVSRTLWIS